MKFSAISKYLVSVTTAILLPASMEAKSIRRNAKEEELAVPDGMAPPTIDKDKLWNNTIVGGELQTEVLPWFVSILSCDSFGFGCAACGGTMVGNDIVMTAAHCVPHGLVPTLAVRGALFVDWVALLSDGIQIFPVSGTLDIHPLWDPNNIGNGHDIAFFKIADLQPNEAVVNVNTVSSVPADGQGLQVVGFGRTDNTDPNSGSMNLKRLDTTAQTCTFSESNVPEQHVCVFASPTTGACQGDSGGPLLTSVNPTSAVQVGIASYVLRTAPETCADGAPDVFMDVFDFNSDIQDYICDNSAAPPASCSGPAPAPTPTVTSPTSPSCNFAGSLRNGAEKILERFGFEGKKEEQP